MDHSALLADQSRRFVELLRGTDPDTPVPACPGWSVRQLVRHVGRGDRWAARIVAERMETPLDPGTVPDGKPPGDGDEALDWLVGGPRLLADAVAATGPDTPVWTFVGPRPARWWLRRRLHEDTVHRVDAAIALGAHIDLPADLAADGVSEMLDIFAVVGGRNGPAPLADGSTLALTATDVGTGWVVRGESGGLSYDTTAGEPGPATAEVRGPAADLLLGLMRRRPTEELGLTVQGDQAVWATWLERTVF